ncbi:MAG TPA: CinA family protein [Candidatus Hydrogenedentes bacterium]|nr:CinA family protein [Candidatus Hydrogenedentota bacterium]HOV74586.1 CinA family protein [Candidatus Hydrogenedentota bacterium]HPC16985.1 CinA family protein [Candidatus Hydrogenedentota bacterium]HRT20876.1 CinA family protein [Candidatus Hydrogenedentota bacterium]HRT66246.1 CinA family protein [Candidatus Hydrogenedentota bacterium]
MDDQAPSLEEQTAHRLLARGATLATAESCSGGLIAHVLTNVPGSSAFFLGGVVAYANTAKTALLGVARATIEAHGAVSEPVAREMAEGARNRFGADYAVACTGIAGPSGGTPDKPVGLVYVAVAGPDGTEIRRHVFTGARKEIKRATAETALRMILERVQ